MTKNVGFKEISASIVVVIVGLYMVTPSTSISGVIVKASDYGNDWPIKASEARIDCDLPDVAYIEVEGVRYALNGGALREGMPRSDTIKKDVDLVFMADFTQKAMQMCIDKRK